MKDYTFQVDTELDRESLKATLSPYRPFRVDVGFSNGFRTREFGDDVKYATAEPLAKLHYFADAIAVSRTTRLLDIGSHLGYYGHHFLRAGIARYVGVETDPRIFGCATFLQFLSPALRGRMRFHNLDFATLAALETLRPDGPFDVLLSLASLNNMLSLTAALTNMAELLAPGGALVLEYLAHDTEEALCTFHPKGYRGDTTLYWIVSQSFVDGFLRLHGITRTRSLLEWENEEAIGAGRKKLMALYSKEA